MVEVDAVEDLVEFAKIERSGGTVPQLTKTGMLRHQTHSSATERQQHVCFLESV